MSSTELLTVRNELYAFWAGKNATWQHQPRSGFASDDHFNAFCIAKDWLQDTAEALMQHRSQGFHADSHQGYIELWGVMQGIVIQQDAFAEMHYAITENRVPFDKIGGTASLDLRDMRNRVVGNPTRKDHGTAGVLFRSAVERQSMTYDAIRIGQYCGTTKQHTTVRLGQLMDAFDKEAAEILGGLLNLLKKRFDRIS